ncbi:NF038130 family PEP-CTERM protein [Nostoc sp. FACHB-280]|uniref:NF038130 family PEP-CTERM protein n=1 Tax=Nostoc sp. FACHB-280 TaxID=2692839 RepID=UPI00168B7742|nr:NF038130 family PEP-CTERM protein [Nostoc sp. FACHB-280]MBD2494122.1 NF038130 family PEP-CTERM protein [Nostoc sp. FACHB-280]
MKRTLKTLVIGASMAVGVSAIASNPAQATTFSFNDTNEIKTYTGGSNGQFITGDTTAAIKALTDKDASSNVELWHSTENPTSNVGFTATKGKYNATVTSVTADDWKSFSSQWVNDLLTNYTPFQSVWNGFSADTKSLVTNYLPSLGMGDPNIGGFQFDKNGGVELKLVGHLDVKSKLASTISLQVDNTWDSLKSKFPQQTTLPTLSEVETLIPQLQTQLDAIPGQITTAQTQLNTVNGQITTAQTQLNTVNGQITTAQNQLNTVNSQITTTQTQLNTVNSQITTTQNQLNATPLTNTTLRQTLTNTLNTLNTQKTQLTSTLSTLNTTKTQLTSGLSTLNTTKTQLTSGINTLNTAKTQLTSGINTLETAKTQLPEQISKLTSFKDILSLQDALKKYEGEIGASEIAKVVTGGKTYYAYSFKSTASGITASDDGVSYSAIYTWQTPGYVSSTSVPEPSVVLGMLGVAGIVATQRKLKKVSG